MTKKKEPTKTDKLRFDYDDYVNDFILNLHYKNMRLNEEIERLKRKIKRLEGKK